MRIAITGLSGFLGHYVAKKLFERDVHIKALVRRSSNTSHLKDYEEKITFVLLLIRCVRMSEVWDAIGDAI